MDNGNNKGANLTMKKLPTGYRLFSQGKKPLEVAIELGLRENQVNKLFREFWR